MQSVWETNNIENKLIFLLTFSSYYKIILYNEHVFDQLWQGDIVGNNIITSLAVEP